MFIHFQKKGEEKKILKQKKVENERFFETLKASLLYVIIIKIMQLLRIITENDKTVVNVKFTKKHKMMIQKYFLRDGEIEWLLIYFIS